MNFYLPRGYIFQNRYQVQSVLGQGGFGITYCCKTIWSERLVAVKELFWNGYMCRAADGRTVELLSETTREAADKMRRRFLQEAKTLQQFEQAPCIVRVLDFFEENSTAYMVTEYVEGETLFQRITNEGIMDPVDVFRNVLPLLRGLEKIHETGYLHRDISADNLMLDKDGAFILVDFGAARDFSGLDQSQISRYIKGSYSPLEQYSFSARLSPATDLYALSAVLYQAITGQMPQISLARLQSDTIRWPSELGIAIDAKQERVLKKGLALQMEDRFQSAGEMAREIEAALPRPKRRRLGIWMAVGVAAAAVGLLFLGKSQGQNFKEDVQGQVPVLTIEQEAQDEEPRFTGETEQFFLHYPERLSDEERRSAQATVAALADTFSQGQYTMEKLDTGLLLTMPLDTFDGQEISAKVKEAFLYQLPDGFSALCEPQVTWLAPEGKNQVAREALTGEVVLLVTGASSYMEDAGQVAIAMQNQWIYQRLDALETPYAMGYLYGTTCQPVIAINTEHLSRGALLILGDTDGSLYVEGEQGDLMPVNSFLMEQPVEVLEADGVCGLAINEDLESTLQTLRDRGETTVYLTLNRDWLDLFNLSESVVLASAPIPAAGEPLAFWEFYLSEGRTISSEQRWLLDYIDYATRNSSQQSSFWVEDVLLLDENGEILWEEDPEQAFGVQMELQPDEVALRELAQTLQADGMDVELRKGRLLIYLRLPESAAMYRAGLEEAVRLSEKYRLPEYAGWIQIYIWDTVRIQPSAQDPFNKTTRCGYVLFTDSADQRTKIVEAIAVSEELAGEEDALQAAWDALTWGENVTVGALGSSVEPTRLYFDLCTAVDDENT